MPTGMDMMVAALLKASGVDIEKVKEDISAYGRQLAEKIASMDAALAQLGKDQTAMLTAMEGLRAGQIVVSDMVCELAKCSGLATRDNGRNGESYGQSEPGETRQRG